MRFFNRPLSTKRMALLTRRLHHAVDGGIPIARCFHLLAGPPGSPRLRWILLPVAHRLEEGATLSEALVPAEGSLSRFFTSALVAGDASGRLDEVTAMMAAHYERRLETIRAIRSQLMYPLLVILTAIVVIPYLRGAILTNLDLGDYTLRYLWSWRYVVVWGLAVWMALGFLWRWPPSRVVLHHLVHWSIPIGSLRYKFAVARFLRFVSIALASGLPNVRAVQAALPVTGNAVVERRVRACIPHLTHQPLAEALGGTGAIPRSVLPMLAIGEQSGRTEASLEKMADTLYEEARHAAVILTGLLGAIAIILIGVLCFL